MTPRATDEEWSRNNIFQSTCTIGNRICRFMIDSGSCENIVSAEALQKLSLRSEPHPKPYKLAWLKKGRSVIGYSRVHCISWYQSQVDLGSTMPPRRRDRVEDAHDRDNLRHLEQRLEQRMDRMMEQLTHQMATLMENQNRRNPNPNSDLDREETEEGSEGENYFVDIPRRQQWGPIEKDRQR
ncbi:hypothetical protein CRG98_046150 [Punica granatum]|uniref:Uncharacterized protein n=1 Tax=Punica granatum TaxID=22663 RepID=A0A2I0HP28_PUNGR|nr:hypothetical protein CRG98_046150 [Punica granatum]